MLPVAEGEQAEARYLVRPWRPARTSRSNRFHVQQTGQADTGLVEAAGDPPPEPRARPPARGAATSAGRLPEGDEPGSGASQTSAVGCASPAAFEAGRGDIGARKSRKRVRPAQLVPTAPRGWMGGAGLAGARGGRPTHSRPKTAHATARRARPPPTCATDHFREPTLIRHSVDHDSARGCVGGVEGTRRPPRAPRRGPGPIPAGAQALLEALPGGRRALRRTIPGSPGGETATDEPVQRIGGRRARPRLVETVRKCSSSSVAMAREKNTRQTHVPTPLPETQGWTNSSTN